MLRDFPYVIWIAFLGILMILITGYVYLTNYKDDSTVQGLTESIRTTAIANVDNSSRIERGSVYLEKEEFESDLKKQVKENINVKTEEELEIIFDYLDNADGSTKAIRVVVDNAGTEYQATVKIDIADS